MRVRCVNEGGKRKNRRERDHERDIKDVRKAMLTTRAFICERDSYRERDTHRERERDCVTDRTGQNNMNI